MGIHPLDEFGKIYIQEVRDDAIEHWHDVMEGKIKAPDLIRLSKTIHAEFGHKTAELEKLIPLIVDSCLTRFLRMFEHHEDLILSKNGVDLNEESDGLVGELFSSEGWIATFSRKVHDEG